MAATPTLTVYLLCYNRIQMAVEALRALTAQADPAVRIVVSDNSTQEGLLPATKQAGLSGFSFLRRQPSLPALDHFNTCMAEVNTPFFMLFHDDDVLLPGAVKRILQTLAQHPDVSAVGINAMIERQGQATGMSFAASESCLHVPDSKALFQRYFGKGNTGIAPFPGYTYATRVRQHCQFSADEGKYSDVAFLMRVAALGPMVWVNEPLMVYRLHSGNDSNTESRRDRLRFLAFLKKHPDWVHTNTLVDYRYFIFKRLSDLSRPSARRAKRYLSTRRALRMPDWRQLARRFSMRLKGKRKSI